MVCLNSQRRKLYHVGIRGRVARSTLADANELRDWQLFEALGHRLIAIAADLYRDEDIGLSLKEPLYAIDSTTIDLCLTLFPWADLRSTKAAVKAHTIIDLRGAIPVFLTITTDRFDLPALTIAQIYRNRWQIELFFKWIKQNLSIKHFFGNSINAVKSQIWIATCVYLLVIIARKQLELPTSPQILLNIFEVNIFEKIPLDKRRYRRATEY